jgi:hypothetical protein
MTGALLVAAAGLAVGLAIGGKTTNHARTQTTTVTHTVTVTTSLAAKTPTGSTNSTTSTSSSRGPSSAGGGGGSAQQYYANYLSTQDTSNGGSYASLDSSPSTIQLKGQTYSHAVAFDLSPNDSNNNSESYQLAIPVFKHFSASSAGLQTSTPAGNSYKLTIYKNNDNPGATVLYTDTFTGPSGTHAVGFDTQGATDLLFVWASTAGDASSTSANGSDVFVFADPVVTS